MDRNIKVNKMKDFRFWISDFELFALYLCAVMPVFLASCSPAVPEFNGERAYADLIKQCSFGPRVPGTSAADSCLQFLRHSLEENSATVVEQHFEYYDAFRDKSLDLTNLLASFNQEARSRIFLAAHWDSRPMADRDPDPENRDKPVPGANDGASGVAVILEIARALNQNKPPVGVDLILFDGEDYGREGHLEEYFLGSRYFARNIRQYRPRFGVLLDMVGDKNLTLPIEGYSQEYLPHIVDKIWSAAEKLGITAFQRIPGQYINDDHRMLIEQGIPCIDIIDFAYPDQSHRYWHTVQDTPDKCSPQSLAAVGTVLLDVIYTEGWE
jgi:hypothetical protein